MYLQSHYFRGSHCLQQPGLYIRHLDCPGTNAFVIILLQSVISVSVDMLPLPGGMGISEKLFSMIFEPVFGSALLIPGMILSRGLGYYTELLISAIFTIVANFTIGRNLRKKA